MKQANPLLLTAPEPDTWILMRHRTRFPRATDRFRLLRHRLPPGEIQVSEREQVGDLSSVLASGLGLWDVRSTADRHYVECTSVIDGLTGAGIVLAAVTEGALLLALHQMRMLGLGAIGDLCCGGAEFVLAQFETGNSAHRVNVSRPSFGPVFE